MHVRGSALCDKTTAILFPEISALRQVVNTDVKAQRSALSTLPEIKTFR